MISATKVKSKLEERLKTHFKKGDTNVMAHFTTHQVHVTQLQTSGLRVSELLHFNQNQWSQLFQYKTQLSKNLFSVG